MRGNADAGVRKSTQEKVTKLQSAIDEILAKAAQQKTEQELTARNATDSWYQQALQNLDTSARSSASTEYAAEQEAAAKIQAAQLEAAAKARAAALEAAKDNSAARGKYAQALMTNSNTLYGADDAWAEAYARYPGSDEQQNAYYTAYSNAKSKGYSSAAAAVAAKAAVEGTDATEQLAEMAAQEYIGTKNLWKNVPILKRAINAVQSETARGVKGGTASIMYQLIRDDVLKKDGTYKAASSTEQAYMRAVAAGNAIAAKYGAGSKNTKEQINKLASSGLLKNDQQYYAACRAAGLQVNG